MLTNIIQNPLHEKIASGLSLFVIFLFAVFLRLEDFSDWHKGRWVFKYQNEYLMTNLDSYYYLQFGKDLQNGAYTSVNQKRRIPNGVERPTIPPLLSMLTFGVSQMAGIDLATVAIFIPVFLSSLLAFVVFLLARQLSLNRTATLSAALFAVIAVGYVGRTRLGVFDTDSMNVVFALLNSYLFLRFALIQKLKRYWFFAAGMLNTFLYFVWWNTAGSVVLLSAFVPLLVAVLWFYQEKNLTIKYALWGFLCGFGLLLLYFLGEQLIGYIQLLIFGQDPNDFPRASGSVGELEPASLGDLIKKTTDNVALFIVAMIGIVYFIRQQKMRVLLIIAPIVLAFLPFIAGNRFAIFSAPIVALGIGFSVQLLFDFKGNFKLRYVYLLIAFIVSLGIYSSYKTTTFKIFEPAILQVKHKPLLNALKANTPDGADIWSDWPIGYVMQYYLNRGSFADGEIDDEIFYYLNFPLAAENLRLAANFMRFYHQHGKAGMDKLYATIGSRTQVFRLLKTVLSHPPERAEKVLANKIDAQPELKTAYFPDVDAWLKFLYPPQNKPLYLLLSHRMLETMSWFTQGKADLETGETEGLSLFLSFYGLQENAEKIQNKMISINKKDGSSIHVNGAKNNFATIRTDNNGRVALKRYKPLTKSFRDAYKRFVFEWQKNSGYGAAMSKEVANTVVNKLFMRAQKSKHFQPISLKTPQYQIWQVYGDVYAK